MTYFSLLFGTLKIVNAGSFPYILGTVLDLGACMCEPLCAYSCEPTNSHKWTGQRIERN